MMKKTPVSFHMPRNKHEQAAMLWQGFAIEVDAGIEPLLSLFNGAAGIATVASCIGDKEDLGYVAFTGDSIRLVKSWVRRFEQANCAGTLQEVTYIKHTNFGCIRFETAQIDEVCRLVSGTFGDLVG